MTSRERARAKRKRRLIFRLKQVGALVLMVAIVVALGAAIFSGIGGGKADTPTPSTEPTREPHSEEAVSESSTSEPEEEPEVLGDPHNYEYPYNLMSADWGAEVYEEGFRYFEIPDEYVQRGGCFPEVVQVYLWCLCRERGIDYYMVVALIERESGYRWDAVGDGGNSVGYMQVTEKWHRERMKEEGVVDLSLPYGNIRVGLNFLQLLNKRYLKSSGAHCVLMAYNMGESGARSLWKEGIYSTEYTKAVLRRADQIRQELEQE